VQLLGRQRAVAARKCRDDRAPLFGLTLLCPTLLCPTLLCPTLL
jgi:hypothetical protein